ncbi:cellulose binding domain-containing protein [Micromonospora sp. NPDC049891]|nr:cellulose-binding protein [Micromonospora sp. CP22]
MTLAYAVSAVAGAQMVPAAADVIIAAASAGCGRTPTLTNGNHSLQVGETQRSYILRLPANYNNTKPHRLIFGIHWLGGSASDVANGNMIQPFYGLQALANNSTIFVAPQGLTSGGLTGWPNTGGQDVTFIDNIIRTVEADLCIDTSQRFSLGFSYGGGMSYALACARPDMFRAVAVYNGGLISECNGGTQPIAYMQVHGVSDTVLPISGARTMRNRFVASNGCTAANPPETTAGSGTHTSFTYSGCVAGRPVAWHTFDGGHTPTPTDRDGSQWLPAETWRFFTQFGSAPPTGSPSPTSPPTGTPSPSPSTPPGSAACQVGYSINAWNTGLTTAITITNTGGAPINGWSLAFTLPGGQTITSGWNATFSPASGAVTARNVSYNGTIAAGTSVSLGFQATHTGDTGRPTQFTLNGATCSIA